MLAMTLLTDYSSNQVIAAGIIYVSYSPEDFRMSMTYLTTEELSSKIKYDPRTIRQQLKDSVLLEGRHYIRPFGGRKILYLWESIEQDMLEGYQSSGAIPFANGGVSHG